MVRPTARMTAHGHFQILHELFTLSDMQHPDNLLARIVDLREGFGSPDRFKAWCDLEQLLSMLDAESRHQLFERAAPLVTERHSTEGRGWTRLFETLNESKGYSRLLSLGYSNVRFLPRESHSTPDVHGQASFGDGLLEVKTVNMSDEAIRLRGTLQEAHFGLPDGLKHKLATDYATACKQLHSVQLRRPTRRICYFCISVDLKMWLDHSNKQGLYDYLASVEGDCEIFYELQNW